MHSLYAISRRISDIPERLNKCNALEKFRSSFKTNLCNICGHENFINIEKNRFCLYDEAF